MAQIDPTAPATVRVTLLKHKPAQAGPWSEMYREVILPYYKKKGEPFASYYRVRFGEGTGGLVTDITAYDRPAQLGDEALKKYQAATRTCIESSETWVQRKHTDLSFGAPTEKPEKLLSVSHITIAPGRRADFIKNFKENGLPRWKKMGIPSLVTWEILYGEKSGRFVVVVPIESFGDLANGTPFYRGMSEADRAKLLTNMDGVITHIQRAVVEYRDDMSFVAEQ